MTTTLSSSGAFRTDFHLHLAPYHLPELEASVAPQSMDCFWEGLDGELGVVLATYEELPLESQVRLTIHVSGEASLETTGTVRFLRAEQRDGWPGMGIEVDPSEELRATVHRFARRRPSLFHSV
ncbi:MAG: hypothetical protein AAGE52_35325 [Myxococcota bacterium]